MKAYNIIRKLSCLFLGLAMFLSLSSEAFAQSSDVRQIKGQVFMSDNQPAMGAGVVIKGTTNGVIVDLDGNFTIDAKTGDVLVVSLIGAVTQEVTVTNKSTIKVILEDDVLSLDDVVVVAYGVQEKATVTGAINSIGTDEILRSNAANITNALSGTMAGLTTVQRSGEPGKDAATMRIRGIGTLTDANAAPLIIIDGVERDSMDMLDPNEVASINILKDASATAVYGVRGANGVIIVTTRMGDEGKPKVTLSTNLGWQSYTIMPQLVNAYEHATLYNEGIDNDGSGNAKFPDFALEAYRTNSNPMIYSQTDWVDAMLKDSAPQQQYNINVSGGTKKVKYFVSFGLLHQEGIYKDYEVEGVNFSINPNYNRYNFRANVDAELIKGLTLKLRMGTTFTHGNYAGLSTASIFSNLLNTTPYGMPTLEGRLFGGYVGNDPLEGIRKSANPILSLYQEGYQINNTSKYNLSADLSYDLGFITKGLSINAKVAYDDLGNYVKKYTPGSLPTYKLNIIDADKQEYLVVNAADEKSFGVSQSYGSRFMNLYLEAGINYARSFGLHKVTALALYNQRTQEDPSFQYKLPKGLLGFVGRVTYNYDNRYLAEVNLGYNGSENFAEGRRFGIFPAFSLGWILTQEKWIPKNKILTYAKIRGSYGIVGNDQIGGDRYLYLPTAYEYPKNGYNFGTYGDNRQFYGAAKEGEPGNSMVTWEKAKKANIGLDIKMFKSQLSYNCDLFYEHRNNILWNYGTVPSIVGNTPAPANIGEVMNRGFEMELGWNSNIGEVNYWLNGVFSYAKNKIMYMDEPQMAYPWLMDTGYSVGQYKGWLNEGFINTTADLENQPQHGWGTLWDKGELNFIDVNGDGMIDSNDKIPIGYGDYPEITFGLNLGLKWKGFEVSALFQGATNVTCYLKQEAVCPLYYSRSAQKWHLGRWTEERYLAGETITYPRMLSDNINSPSFINPDPLSTFWLYDASYLRLRNLEIAYTLRLKGLKKAGIDAVRFNINGTNLCTWSYMTNFDPESPSGKGTFYPMPKVYSFGAKIVF